MDSDPEDCKNMKDSKKDHVKKLEINGEVNTPQENGKHPVILPDDSSLHEESVAGKSENETFVEDPISVIKASSEQVERKTEVCSEEADSTQSLHKDANDIIVEANGETKSNLQTVAKDGKPLVQRRMSLRPRAAPKKYADAEGSSDDDRKEALAAKDPLEIPLGKNSSTVLIRKSPTVPIAGATILKSPPKSPIKMTKVTRPPPELIKAPILSKISISSATSVTVVPRSKENNSSSSGFVVVDTQSILKGKNSTPVNNIPASVTVSAVPSAPKTVPKPVLPPVTSAPSRKSTTPSNSNSNSLPDPFESLGKSGFQHCYVLAATNFRRFIVLQV